MRNLFLSPSAKLGCSTVIIDGDYYPYLKNVIRVRRGTKLKAIISGIMYELEVEKIEKSRIICSIKNVLKPDESLPVKINVYQSLLKFRKMDFVVSKLSEIGIESFYPVICDRTVPRDVPGSSRIERWKRLVAEGGKSSGNFKLMRIEPAAPFDDIIKRMDRSGHLLLLFMPDKGYPHILDVLNNNTLRSFGAIDLFFGPEGGFTNREVELMLKNDGNVVNMGSVTLRSDTAAVIGTGLVKIILERIWKN